MSKPMSPEDADALTVHRKTAGIWLKMQYMSGLHMMHTGERKYPSHVFNEWMNNGKAALLEIERILRKYR